MTARDRGGRDAAESESSITRRSVLRAASGAVIIAGVAGCVQSTSRSYEATPIRLNAEAHRRGFALVDEHPLETTRDVASDDDRYEVRVVSHTASYERDDEAFASGVTVGLMSMPAGEVGGTTLSPMATQTLGDLLTTDVGAGFLRLLRVESQWQRGPEEVSTTSGILLDSEVTVRTFAGITVDDEFVLMNAVRHETGDDVVLVGDVRRMRVESADGPLVGDTGIVSRAAVAEVSRVFTDVLALVTTGSAGRDDTDSNGRVSIAELNRDPEAWIGETVEVAGVYSANFPPNDTVSHCVLVEDYARVAQDRALSGTGTLPLSDQRLTPPEPEFEANEFVMTGTVEPNDQLPDAPEDPAFPPGIPNVQLLLHEFEHVGVSEESRYVSPLSPVDSSTTFEPLPTNPETCRFAIIISGGIDAFNNHPRYWNDVVYTFEAMYDGFGIPRDRIYVHYFNGPGTGWAEEVDGSVIVDDDASEAAITATFDELREEIDACRAEDIPTEVLLFTYNHGTNDDPPPSPPLSQPGKTLLGMTGETSVLTPRELRELFEELNAAGLDDAYVMMKQCYSGQFLEARDDQPNVDLMHVDDELDWAVTAIATAGENDEVTYSQTGQDGYGEFGYHFVAALVGEYPDGTSVTDVAGPDDLVSWWDAFGYAVKEDEFGPHGDESENPQFEGDVVAIPGE